MRIFLFLGLLMISVFTQAKTETVSLEMGHHEFRRLGFSEIQDAGQKAYVVFFQAANGYVFNTVIPKDSYLKALDRVKKAKMDFHFPGVPGFASCPDQVRVTEKGIMTQLCLNLGSAKERDGFLIWFDKQTKLAQRRWDEI